MCRDSIKNKNKQQRFTLLHIVTCISSASSLKSTSVMVTVIVEVFFGALMRKKLPSSSDDKLPELPFSILSAFVRVCDKKRVQLCYDVTGGGRKAAEVCVSHKITTSAPVCVCARVRLCDYV